MNHLELVAGSTFSGRIGGGPAVAARKGVRIAGERTGALAHLRFRLHNGFILAVSDSLALCAGLYVGAFFRLFWLGEAVIPVWSWGILLVWWIGASMLRLLPSWGLGPVEELRRLAILLVSAYGLVTVALFLSKSAEDTSRLTLLVAFAVSAVLVPLARFHIKGALCAARRWGVPTVIYGAGDMARQVVEMLERERGLGYNPAAVFDDNPGTWGSRIGTVRVLGHTDLVSPRAPVAILAMPHLGRSRQIELLEGPLSHYRTVIIIPDLFEAPSLWVRPRDLNGILGLEITSNLTSPLARFVKRAADLTAVVITAPFWGPVCAVVAAIIWLEDRQSPFFRQKRIGWTGEVFSTWKFRTMVPNAEEVLRQRLEEDDALREEWETTYKLKEDPRITRAGRLLRRFSLDELPQLLNVLGGEMSLVGPRPLPAYHHHQLPPRVRDLRERVRPGITGLWQVSGRSDIGTEGMEQWDPYYVRNWSLWLDAVVLIRTLRAVTQGSGAY